MGKAVSCMPGCGPDRLLLLTAPLCCFKQMTPNMWFTSLLPCPWDCYFPAYKRTKTLREGVVVSSAALVLFYYYLWNWTNAVNHLEAKSSTPDDLSRPCQVSQLLFDWWWRAEQGNCAQNSHGLTGQPPRAKPLLGASHVHAHNTPNGREVVKNLFLYLTALGLSCSMWTRRCGMWDLVPWPGIEPRVPGIGREEFQPLEVPRQGLLAPSYRWWCWRSEGLQEFPQKVLLCGRVVWLQGWCIHSWIYSLNFLGRRQSSRGVGKEEPTPNYCLEKAVVIGKIFHNSGPKPGFSVGLSLEVIIWKSESLLDEKVLLAKNTAQYFFVLEHPDFGWL